MHNEQGMGFGRAASRMAVPFAAYALLLLLCFILAIGFKQSANEGGEIPLPSADSLYQAWKGVSTAGDGGWYMSIARDGYERAPVDASGQHNWAYFPGYPLLLKLTGIQIVPALLANALFAFLGYTLLRMHVARYFDVATADAAVVFLIFFPFSKSLFALRPEALIFLCWCAALVAWSSGRKNLAIGVTALAVLLKPEGLAILAYFFIDEVQAMRREGFRLSRYARLAIPLLPVVGYSLYIHALTGDPLAWAKAQAAWGSELFTQPWEQTLQLLDAPMLVGRWGWDFLFVNAICSVAGVALIVAAALRPALRPAAAFGAAIFLLSFLNFGYWQMARHLAVAPTMALGFAALPERLRNGLSPLFIGLGAVTLYLFAAGAQSVLT